MPFAFAPILTQFPLQHWSLRKQTSPLWVQNDTALEQTPLRHRFEQHSPELVHPFPAVRQPPPGFTRAQRPFVQMPLQHSAPTAHAPAVGLSGVHGFVAHFRFEPQKPEQQSPAVVQSASAALQSPPVGVLQTLGLDAPHTPPFGHGAEPTPHTWTPPQPSGTNPQLRPAHAAD